MANRTKKLTTNNGNGHVSGWRDPLDVATIDRIVTNLTSERMEALRVSMGADPRRSVYDECGFPASIGIDAYRTMYERNPIGKRVVEVMPLESWQTCPEVYEDEDPENDTEFEEDWDNLGAQLRGGSFYQDEEGSPVYEYCKRVDVLSGIGSFGVILLGLDDGGNLQDPVEGSVTTNAACPWRESPGPMSKEHQEEYQKTIQVANLETVKGENPFGPNVTEKLGSEAQYFGWYGPSEFVNKNPKPKKRELTFLRVFPEYLVQVVRYEANLRNPRFGQPVLYRITINDPRDAHSGVGLPIASLYVHWSRVVHVPSDGGYTSSETFGVPRQRSVFNNLMGLEKIYGASPEAYWKGCVNPIAFNTHPQLGGDVNIDADDLRDQVENFQNSLQRYLTGIGGTWTSIAPSVTDPTAHIKVQLEAIALSIGCPMRIFMGTERGELASSQDDGAWNDRLKHRQYFNNTPRILIPFIDRLILLGVLRAPKKGAAEKAVRNWRKRGKVVRNVRGGYLVYNAPVEPPMPKSPVATPTPTGGLSDQQTAPKKLGKPIASVSDTGYSITWEDLESNTQLEKAQIATQRVTALQTYIQGGVEAIMPPMEFLTHIMEFDDEEAQAILDAQAEHEEEMMTEQDALAEEHGFEPAPPPGMIDPEMQDMEHEEKMEAAKHGAPPGGGNPFGAKPPFPPKPKKDTVENAFCPTGEGGGMDNSCGQGGGGGGATSHTPASDLKALKAAAVHGEIDYPHIDSVVKGVVGKMSPKDAKALAKEMGHDYGVTSKATAIEAIARGIRDRKEFMERVASVDKEDPLKHLNPAAQEAARSSLPRAKELVGLYHGKVTNEEGTPNDEEEDGAPEEKKKADEHGGHDVPKNKSILMVETNPQMAEAGKAVVLKLMIHDAKGQMLRDFEVLHEEKIHLIFVRAGLDQFAHLHPTVDSSGEISVKYTFPVGGTYHLFADHKPKGKEQATPMAVLKVAGESPAANPLAPNVPGKVPGDGLTAEISIQDSKSAREKSIQFDLRDESGKPVAGLQPYLGEKGHLVILSADAKEFVHSHPADGKGQAANIVVFQTHFPAAGLYKGWGQFKRNDRVHTVPFVVKVD